MYLGMKSFDTNDTSCMGLWSSLTIINRDCQIFSSLDLPFSILKKSQSDPNQFYALTESIEWNESIQIDDISSCMLSGYVVETPTVYRLL